MDTSVNTEAHWTIRLYLKRPSKPAFATVSVDKELLIAAISLFIISMYVVLDPEPLAELWPRSGGQLCPGGQGRLRVHRSLQHSADQRPH